MGGINLPNVNNLLDRLRGNTQFADDLRAIQAIIPPRYQQVGGGVFFDPSTGSFYMPEKNTTGATQQVFNPDTGQFENTAAGGFKLRKLTAAEAKYITGPGGDGSSTRLASDDPRYWQFQYDQLNSQEKIAADQVAAQLVNAGLDSESARRQALAGLLANRNNNAVSLVQTEGDIAAKAAQFAANPRDAFADINYRNAVGGATPYGDQANPAGAQLQTGLADRFQQIFGGIGGDIRKAREFVSAVPPAEYLSPETRSQLGMQPTPPAMQIGAGAAGAPTPAAAPPPGNPLLSRLTPEAAQNYANFDRQQNLARLTPEAAQNFANYDKARGFSEGGTIEIAPALHSGYRPPSSEGGTNMNIHEPSVVMGAHSGHIYATLAEHNPEQMIIKPLPSVQRAQKERMKSGDNFMKATAGAKRNAQGGTITGTGASDFIRGLKENLAPLGGVGGGTGSVIDPNTGLPALRKFAGAPWESMSPTQKQYFYAAQSQAGVSPEEVDWTLGRGTPRGPINNLPRVSFA